MNPESQERVEFRSKIPQGFSIAVPFSVVILQHLCHFIGYRKSLSNLVNLAKGFEPIRTGGSFFLNELTILIIFFCFAAIKQTTCIQCFEIKDFGLFCKNTSSQVPCPSQNQCYTAKGNIKFFIRPDEFITTTIEGRGCANCKGKKVSTPSSRLGHTKNNGIEGELQDTGQDM